MDIQTFPKKQRFIYKLIFLPDMAKREDTYKERIPCYNDDKVDLNVLKAKLRFKSFAELLRDMIKVYKKEKKVD